MEISIVILLTFLAPLTAFYKPGEQKKLLRTNEQRTSHKKCTWHGILVGNLFMLSTIFPVVCKLLFLYIRSMTFQPSAVFFGLFLDLGRRVKFDKKKTNPGSFLYLAKSMTTPSSNTLMFQHPYVNTSMLRHPYVPIPLYFDNPMFW